MLSPTEILRLARAYAEAEDVALSTVAQRACPKNHKIFGRLANGHGANSHTLVAIENFFYANWPEGAAWPADIARRRTAKPACAA
jgi:hypothetical protein